MRCKAVLPGGAETEPPKALGQLSCVEAGGGQGGVALLQERGKAPSDCCIVLRCEVSREVRRKGSQKVVCARGGAEAQQQPRCLEVVDGGDARQEPVMVVALMPELARDERIMSQRGAERCETLRFWRESPVSDPDALFTLAKVSDVGGLLAGGVPDSCFALVQTDSCPVPQRGRESIVERSHAVGRCDDVRIVEEGEHLQVAPAQLSGCVADTGLSRVSSHLRIYCGTESRIGRRCLVLQEWKSHCARREAVSPYPGHAHLRCARTRPSIIERVEHMSMCMCGCVCGPGNWDGGLENVYPMWTQNDTLSVTRTIP